MESVFIYPDIHPVVSSTSPCRVGGRAKREGKLRLEPQVGNIKYCQSKGPWAWDTWAPQGPGPKGKIQTFHLGGGEAPRD